MTVLTFIWKALRAFIRWNWILDHGGMGAIAQPQPRGRRERMITSAVQRGRWVSVYSGNETIFSKSGTLVGYTSRSVSVQNKQFVTTYDERGMTIGSTVSY
jgi:hypothetical protein